MVPCVLETLDSMLYIKMQSLLSFKDLRQAIKSGKDEAHFAAGRGARNTSLGNQPLPPQQPQLFRV